MRELQPPEHDIQRPSPAETPLSQPAMPSPAAVVALQRQFGNRVVQRIVGRRDRPAAAARRAPLDKPIRDRIEAVAGLSLADVEVHYNSPEPAQVDALAFARGSEIHLAPGQERHLPHEAWHIVQQKQGRVQPTTRVNGTAVNDDPRLESEATDFARDTLAPDRYNPLRRPETKKTARLAERSVHQRMEEGPSEDDGPWNQPEEALQDRIERILRLIAESLPERPAELMKYDRIFAQLGAFLEDKNRMFKYFKELEETLIARYGSLEQVPSDALERLLTEKETALGFNSAPVDVNAEAGVGPVILIGTIPAETFLQRLISNGVTRSDPGFDSHGSLSHRLQWYAIARELAENPQAYDNVSAMELYQAIPRYGRFGYQNSFSLWDILVDAIPEGDRRAEEYPGFPASSTGRSPDIINAYLHNREAPWGNLLPFLATAVEQDAESGLERMAALFHEQRLILESIQEDASILWRKSK